MTFLNSLPEGEKLSGKSIMVFGIIWNRIEDYLQISTFKQSLDGVDITRRHVLIDVSKIYDQLGLIGPITLSKSCLYRDCGQCKNCIFVLPVNILLGVARQLLGLHHTPLCVLIYITVIPRERVLCLIYTHKHEGRRPECECVYQAKHEFPWYN